MKLDGKLHHINFIEERYNYAKDCFLKLNSNSIGQEGESSFVSELKSSWISELDLQMTGRKSSIYLEICDNGSQGNTKYSSIFGLTKYTNQNF